MLDCISYYLQSEGWSSSRLHLHLWSEGYCFTSPLWHYVPCVCRCAQRMENKHFHVLTLRVFSSTVWLSDHNTWRPETGDLTGLDSSHAPFHTFTITVLTMGSIPPHFHSLFQLSLWTSLWLFRSSHDRRWPVRRQRDKLLISAVWYQGYDHNNR